MRGTARALAWSVVIVVGAGCTVGAPPGFSSGDRWTFPLVGPLEDGLLVTPVSVRGHGPYLFAIDPDANVTAIDKQVAEEAGLRIGTGPHRIDETDTGHVRYYAELFDLKIANLTIDRRDVMVFPVGHYDTDTRHLHGILGRDVIADSMAFGFDRDQGIAMLTTLKAFTPPPDAIAISYEVVSSRATAGLPPTAERQYDPDSRRLPREALLPLANLGDMAPVPRRLATMQIGGTRFVVHLDLGGAVSQLATASWRKAQLAPADLKLRLVDEAASAREVSTAGVATEVTLGTARSSQVTFVPFIDKRFSTARLDGVLGLGFFRPYAVYASWDSKTFYLKPRGDAAATTTARLGRWGAELPACPHPGCVTADLVTSDSGVVVSVARDAPAANRRLEVFLGVTPAAGKTASPLIVELPAGVDKVSQALPADYAGATLAVLDVSPFSRSCAGDGGCIGPLGGLVAPRTESSPEGLPPAAAPPPAVAPPPAAAGPARTVVIEKLRRVTGDPAIPPSDDVLKAAAGKPIAAAIVKLCLTPEGKVDSTKIVKSSGVPAYDQQLQTVIKATWAFEPVEADGKPEPVCTSVTFLTH